VQLRERDREQRLQTDRMADVTRVKKELIDVRKDTLSGVTADLVEDGNFRHLLGTLKGPTATVYEGGMFLVDIVIPPNYPFVPPKMKFLTKIWHPNVSSVTGAICLDILKDQWSPALTIKTALVSLQALLSAPEPTDPQDAEVAKQFLNEPKVFEQTARHWTKSYATEAADVEKVENLVGMGFAEDKVKIALKLCAGDEGAALEKLLSGA